MESFLILFRKNQAFKWYLLFLLVSLIYQWISPSFLVDSYEYLNASSNFQDSGTFSSCLHNQLCDHILPETRRTPAYPLLIYAFGHYGLLIIQILLAAFVPVIAFNLLEKLQGNQATSRQNLLFGIFIFTYPLQFYYASMLMPEIFCQFLILLLIWFGIESKYLHFSVTLSLLLLLKPVFILLLPIPVVLLFYKYNKFKWVFILPLFVFITFSYFNYKHYQVFHYSSVSVENKYEFNAVKLFHSTNDILPADSMLKRMSFADRYRLLDSLGNKIIRENFSDYFIYHIKGTILACIDPGRYDLIAFFKFKNMDGFMSAVREGGWLSILKNQSVFVLLYLFVFTLINASRIAMAMYSMKKYFKKLYLIYIFIFILVGVTGPVGSARYLFPIMPIISVLAVLSAFKHEKNISIK